MWLPTMTCRVMILLNLPYSLAEKWGIGQKGKDNGILILDKSSKPSAQK